MPIDEVACRLNLFDLLLFPLNHLFVYSQFPKFIGMNEILCSDFPWRSLHSVFGDLKSIIFAFLRSISG